MICRFALAFLLMMSTAASYAADSLQLTRGDYVVKLTENGLEATWKGKSFICASHLSVAKPKWEGALYSDNGQLKNAKASVKGDRIIIEDSIPEAGLAVSKEIRLDNSGLTVNLKMSFSSDKPCPVEYLAGALPDKSFADGRYRMTRLLGESSWLHLPAKNVAILGNELLSVEIEGGGMAVKVESVDDKPSLQFFDMRERKSSPAERNYWCSYTWTACKGERAISTRFTVTAATNQQAKPAVAIETRKGRTPVLGIALPTAATPVERAAATELQSYLSLMGCAELPIVEEKSGTPLSGAWIFVGRELAVRHALCKKDELAKLGYDGFLLRSSKDGMLCVAGKNERGTLYAAYRLLESLGCKFYTQEQERIPLCKNGITLESGLDVSDSAALEWRAMNGPIQPMKETLTPREWPEYVLGAKMPGMVAIPPGGKTWHHTLGYLLPVAELAKSHPEQLALFDNVRKVEEAPIYQQFCLSNPELAKLVENSVLNWIKNDPEHLYYPVHYADTPNFCECDACKAWYAKNGGVTEAVVSFSNQIAKAVAKEFPDKYITMLAYHSTRIAPKGVRLEPNLLVIFAPIRECQGRPWTANVNMNMNVCRDLENWIAIHPLGGKGIMTFEYPMTYKYTGIPYPALYAFAENMRYYKKLGVRGTYVCGINSGSHLEHLYGYVIPKLMWNPDADLELLIDDFTKGWYGPAAKPMRQYIETLHERAINSDCDSVMDCHDGPRQKFFREFYSPEFLAKSYALFAKAESLANGDTALKNRIAKEKWGLLFADLSLSAARDIVPTTNDAGLLRAPNSEDYAKISELLAIHKLFGKSWEINSKGWHHFTLSSFTGFTPDVSPWWKSAKACALIENPSQFAKDEAAAAENARKGVIALESKSLQVLLTPKLGGRIWRIYSKDLKADIMFRKIIPESAMSTGLNPSSDFNPGGYDECTEPALRSPGWSEAYSAELKDGGKTVVMSALLSNGLKVVRTVSLADGEPAVAVKSRVENVSNRTVKDAQLRTHPELLLQKRHEMMKLSGKAANGSWEDIKTFDIGTITGNTPAGGAWKISHWGGSNLSVTEEFEPAQVDSWSARIGFESYSIELLSKKRDLAPGEALELNHRYIIGKD